LALLAFYGGAGPIAAFSELAFGDPLSITWTLWIVILAHVLETFPYMVRAISSGLVKLNPQLESAARSLGASNSTVFLTITLPQLRSSLVGGAVLVFARSIAEFGATIVVVSAVLRTAPIVIYVNAEAGSLELSSAYSVLLMLMSLIAYFILSRGVLEGEKRAMARA
jgi:thiamine transport system permease protein